MIPCVMAARRRTVPDRPTHDLPFSDGVIAEAVIRAGRNVRGVLRSPLLDRVLFPACEVAIEMSGAATPDGGFSPDSFQLESLRSFVAMQSRLRPMLEPKLIAFRDRYVQALHLTASENLWDDCPVRALYLEKKKIWTPQGLENMRKMLHVPADQVLAHADKPETRSCFTLEVAFPWDHEHGPWLAVFRDDALDSFGTV